MADTKIYKITHSPFCSIGVVHDGNLFIVLNPPPNVKAIDISLAKPFLNVKGEFLENKITVEQSPLVTIVYDDSKTLYYQTSEILSETAQRFLKGKLNRKRYYIADLHPFDRKGDVDLFRRSDPVTGMLRVEVIPDHYLKQYDNYHPDALIGTFSSELANITNMDSPVTPTADLISKDDTNMLTSLNISYDSIYNSPPEDINNGPFDREFIKRSLDGTLNEDWLNNHSPSRRVLLNIIRNLVAKQDFDTLNLLICTNGHRVLSYYDIIKLIIQVGDVTLFGVLNSIREPSSPTWDFLNRKSVGASPLDHPMTLQHGIWDEDFFLLAAKYGRLDIIDELLNYNDTSLYMDTPKFSKQFIANAVKSGDLRTFEYAIEQYGDINIVKKLLISYINNDTDHRIVEHSIRVFVELFKGLSDTDAESEVLNALLPELAEHNRLEQVRLLLQYDYSIQIDDALYIAVAESYPDIIQLLLDAGGNVQFSAEGYHYINEYYHSHEHISVHAYTNVDGSKYYDTLGMAVSIDSLWVVMLLQPGVSIRNSILSATANSAVLRMLADFDPQTFVEIRRTEHLIEEAIEEAAENDDPDHIQLSLENLKVYLNNSRITDRYSHDKIDKLIANANEFEHPKEVVDLLENYNREIHTKRVA
jgi:hypothetical protein